MRARGAIARVLTALLACALGGCGSDEPEPGAVAGAVPSTAVGPPICHECFWEYQPAGLREELTSFYRGFATDDPLVRADIELLLARVEGRDPCPALDAFDVARGEVREVRRRALLDATTALLAAGCGRDAEAAYLRAAASARAAGRSWQAEVFAAQARGDFVPRFDEASVERDLRAPPATTAVVIGESAIPVRAGDRVGVQVERVVRDWLSYQMAHDFSARAPRRASLLDYHEGARLRDLIEHVELRVVPLSGVLVARRDGRWFGPDETGTFRFQVLDDKLWYPTTRADGDLAWLVDTHGIASLVEPALRERADLVIGCADHPGKVAAAFHLAARGVDVYFPCDRFVGDLLGYRAPGVLIGSAPVSGDADGAVIGNRPLRIELDEVVVVQDTDRGGVLQYYDAPARYFEALAAVIPLRTERVAVDAAGESARVVDRAERIGARVIAVRVWTAEDYGPVRRWLAASGRHRAVLFHSAPYPAGYRLFSEFPRQTTFGDPRPRFVSGP